MFALLVPAGFAVIVRVLGKKQPSSGDPHERHREAEARAKAAAKMRGAAAGALPDVEVEHWRQRAVLATERIKGLETIVTARGRQELRRGLGYSSPLGGKADRPPAARRR